jgi:hypothetical protein
MLKQSVDSRETAAETTINKRVNGYNVAIAQVSITLPVVPCIKGRAPPLKSVPVIVQIAVQIEALYCVLRTQSLSCIFHICVSSQGEIRLVNIAVRWIVFIPNTARCIRLFW